MKNIISKDATTDTQYYTTILIHICDLLMFCSIVVSHRPMCYFAEKR